MMSANLPAATTSIEELLRHNPESSRVLIDFKTDCLGCRMARFCTLTDVADIYGLDLELFLAALLKNASAHQPKNLKEKI